MEAGARVELPEAEHNVREGPNGERAAARERLEGERARPLAGRIYRILDLDLSNY